MELLKLLNPKYGLGFFELINAGYSRGYLIKELRELRLRGAVEKWDYPYGGWDGINTCGSYWVLTAYGQELKEEL